jgi:hypothetical protein
MSRHPLYFALGLLLIVGAFVADVRGWTLAGATERVRGGPRSVRENPGAYRSVYRSSARFRHGK